MSTVPFSLRRRSGGDRVRGGLFYALLLFSITIGFVLLGTLLADVFR